MTNATQVHTSQTGAYRRLSGHKYFWNNANNPWFTMKERNSLTAQVILTHQALITLWIVLVQATLVKRGAVTKMKPWSTTSGSHQPSTSASKVKPKAWSPREESLHSKAACPNVHAPTLLKCRFWSAGLGWGLGFCISIISCHIIPVFPFHRPHFWHQALILQICQIRTSILTSSPVILKTVPQCNRWNEYPSLDCTHNCPESFENMPVRHPTPLNQELWGGAQALVLVLIAFWVTLIPSLGWEPGSVEHNINSLQMGRFIVKDWIWKTQELRA